MRKERNADIIDGFFAEQGWKKEQNEPDNTEGPAFEMHPDADARVYYECFLRIHFPDANNTFIQQNVDAAMEDEDFRDLLLGQDSIRRRHDEKYPNSPTYFEELEALVRERRRISDTQSGER
jgi:hypothetical protein